MKKSAGQKRSGWFWVGVGLLSLSALWWLVLILVVIIGHEDAFDTFLGGVVITIIPIGIGIYGIRRGRKAQAVEVQPGSEPAAKPVRETRQSHVGLIKDTQSEIVIKMPWWFHVVAWSCVLFLLPIGIWMVGMTTKVIFNRPPGYMTVTRGHIPVFLWFLRGRVISREEAKSVFACVINNWWDEGSHHEVRVVANSGKEVRLCDAGRYGNKANYLAKRIREFGQQ